MSGPTPFEVFQPQVVQRNRCAHCGTLRHAHKDGTLECPQTYRPPTIGDAIVELERAAVTGDQHRVFAARGDLQRLMDHRPNECRAGGLVCAACSALAENEVIP